jgi:hypothetical protein
MPWSAAKSYIIAGLDVPGFIYRQLFLRPIITYVYQDFDEDILLTSVHH